MSRIRHTGKPQYWAGHEGKELVHGVLAPTSDMLHRYTDMVVETSEKAYVAALPAEELQPLPDAGWLKAGEIYAYDGVAVMVRQSHRRTKDAPADVPALFVVHRAEAASVLDWIAGEQVYVGTERTYKGETYRCIQAHVTQDDWTPDATPALWKLVAAELEPGIAEWKAGATYKVGDRVTYEGTEYECRQSHTAQAGWEPPRVLALWTPVVGAL